MTEDKIIPYIEPIFRFCCKRLSNRCDAEDLASEIICHVIEGMNKYQIESLDAWVWRIAHNRYARFIDNKNRNQIILSGDDELFELADYTEFDKEYDEQEYETVFRYLHTLSSEYKNIFVDYYVGELSIRELATKYSLPETTVKWRLNTGRQKIRERIGEHKMDKIYKRINWDTTTCNGRMDPDKYLHSQVARAICLAAYEKPLTIEEISISTGIPTMYIEDELSRLEYGDAVRKIKNKYATDFIIFRLCDKKQTENVSLPLVKLIADKIEETISAASEKIKDMDFYGNDFGVERLGYFIAPYLLRKKVRNIQYDRLGLKREEYPPRKDGGYGWYIVEETDDENERYPDLMSGCNIAWNTSRKTGKKIYIYYYWINKYFDNGIYNNTGTRWLCDNLIPQSSKDTTISKDRLSDEAAAELISSNLIVKSNDDYKINFACFTDEQFRAFAALFDISDNKIDNMIADWIIAVRNQFEKFVPARLHDQINQWITGYTNQITGYVVDELIERGFLRKPDEYKPLTDGVFYIEGNDDIEG